MTEFTGMLRASRLRPAASVWVAAVICIGLGALVPVSTGYAIAFLVGLAVLAALLITPPWLFPTALLCGTFIVPVALVESGRRGISLSGTPFAGQAWWIVFAAAIFAGRVVATRSTFRIPALVGASMAIYLLMGGIALVTAGLSGTYYGGALGDFARQAIYALAAIVGVGAAATVREERVRLQLFRALGWFAILVSLLSAVYWLLVTHRLGVRLPVLSSIVANVHGVSLYGTRSIFPFTQDSPNTGSVLLVMLGVFSVPVLLASAQRANRRFALAVIVAVVLGVLSTQSRTGLLALAAAPWPYVLTSRSRERRRAMAGLLVVAVFAFQGYRLLPVTRHFSLQAGTFVAREGIWSQAEATFLQKPLFGKGYRYSAQNVFVEAQSPGGASEARLQSVQSEYLGRAVDGGVVGLVLFAAFLGALFASGMRLLRTTDRAVGVSMLGVLAAVAVAMAGSTVLQSAAVLTVLWLCLGICGGMYARRADQ